MQVTKLIVTGKCSETTTNQHPNLLNINSFTHFISHTNCPEIKISPHLILSWLLWLFCNHDHIWYNCFNHLPPIKKKVIGTIKFSNSILPSTEISTLLPSYPHKQSLEDQLKFRSQLRLLPQIRSPITFTVSSE